METYKSLIYKAWTLIVLLLFTLPSYGSRGTSDEKTCQVLLEQNSSPAQDSASTRGRRRSDQARQSLKEQFERLASSPEVLAGLDVIYDLVIETGNQLPGLSMAPDDFLKVAAWDTTLVNKLVRIIHRAEENGYKPRNAKSLVTGLKALIRVNELSLKQAYESEESANSGRSQGFYSDDAYAVRWSTEETLDGEVYATINYTIPVVLYGSKVSVWQRREGSVDKLTDAIDARSGGGEKMLRDFVHLAEMDSEPWYYIFVDLDNLNLVNGFRHAHGGGDDYIRSMNLSFRRVLRSYDQFFRVGGDEWVVIIRGLKPEQIKGMIKRLTEDFYYNVEANKIFAAQWEFLETSLDEIEQVSSWDQLSVGAQSLFIGDEATTQAHEKYQTFKDSFVAEKRAELEKMRYLLKPTLSVGSTLIREGDTDDSLKDRGSRNVNGSKRYIKTKLGQDSTKYGGPGEDPELIENNIRNNVVILPKVAAPDEFTEED